MARVCVAPCASMQAYGARVTAERPEIRDEHARRGRAAHRRACAGEAERIARLSRIREFVLGAQDGLLVPLGVVTGMAAANPARSLIIVAGLAEAVAGAISMGGGSYLASQAEEQLFASEIASEGQEIDDFPERETAELALILEREGLDRPQAETVARGLASNPNVFLRTKIEKELGISAGRGRRGFRRRPRGRRSPTSSPPSCPLWPYFFFRLHTGARRQPGLHAVRALPRGRGQGTRDPALARARRPPGGGHRLGQRRRRLRHRACRHQPCGLARQQEILTKARAGSRPAASRASVGDVAG